MLAPGSKSPLTWSFAGNFLEKPVDRICKREYAKPRNRTKVLFLGFPIDLLDKERKDSGREDSLFREKAPESSCVPGMGLRAAVSSILR